MNGAKKMENRLTIKQKLLIGSLVVYLFSLFVFIESADTYIYSKIAFLCTFILAIINIRKENIYLTNIDIAFVLFVFMCSLSCLWSRWQAKSIETSITMLQLMLMFCVLRMALRAFADSKLFENIIIISGLGMCVFYLYEYGISGYLSALNGIGRIGSEYENTNTIGGSGAFILVVSLLTGMNERKWYYFIVSFFAGFIVLGSGSKTAILISILGSLGAILVAKKKRKGSKLSKLLFIVVIVITLFYIIKNIADISFLNSTYDRFEQMFDVFLGRSAYVHSSTSDRIDMMKVGLNTFFRFPFWGCGIYAMKDILASHNLHYIIIHCNYLELLADLGIVGFSLYYYIYCNIISKVKYCSEINRGFVICMVVLMLLLDVTGVTYYTQRIVLFLVMISVVLENDKDMVRHGVKTKFVFGSRS